MHKSPKEMEILINKLKGEVASLKAQLLEHGIIPRQGAIKGATADDAQDGDEEQK